MAITITENTMRVNTHKTYNVQFFNDEVIYTTVTSNAEVVTSWIDDYDDEIKYLYDPADLIVGLDIEWNPHFAAGRRNPVATLQLCVLDRCLVYQIIHADRIPESLADFLTFQRSVATFVGVGIKADLDKLQADYGIGGDALYEDLRGIAAEEYGREELKRTGLYGLASVVLLQEVEKPTAVRMSRWDNQRLTAEQVKYACVDAYLSFEIGRSLGLGYFDDDF